ncbi:MAG: response regulator [Nitrospira sp.]|nr:response regulator [Nitrospira sp.]
MSSELDRQGLVDIFVFEASEAMAVLRKAFYPSDGSEPTPAQLQEQYVWAHKVRGASGLYGYEGLALMGCLLESTLEDAPSIETSLWPKALEVMRGLVASFESQLKIVAVGGAEDLSISAQWKGEVAGFFPSPAAAVPSQHTFLTPDYLLPALADDVLSCFVPESQEFLQSMESLLQRLRDDSRDREAIHRLYRMAHTVRGSAHSIGFKAISDVARSVEDCMIAVREGRVSISSDVIGVFSRAVEVIRLLVSRNEAAIAQLQRDVPEVTHALAEIRNGEQMAGTAQAMESSAPASQVATAVMDRPDEPAAAWSQSATVQATEPNAPAFAGEPDILELPAESAEAWRQPIAAQTAEPTVPVIHSAPEVPDRSPESAGVGAAAIPVSTPLADAYLIPHLDLEVLSYFAPEAQEYLEALEAQLLGLEKEPQNFELIDRLFRTAHTLKGSAYTVGFQSIGDLTHYVEDFMMAVREGRAKILPGHSDVLLRSIDVVRLLMRLDTESLDTLRLRFGDVINELKQLDQPMAAQVVEQGEPVVRAAAAAEDHAEESDAATAASVSDLLTDEYLVPDLDAEVLSYFAPEAQEYIEALETRLLRLDKELLSPEVIDQLFRTAHTLKGSAYTVGFQSIGDLMHYVEDFMMGVREGRAQILPGHSDTLLRSLDVIKLLMRRDPTSLDMLRRRFTGSMAELKQLDQLKAAQALELESAPVAHPIDPSLGESAQRQETVDPAKATDGKTADGKAVEDREVIRVSRDRLERLLNLVGELVIGRGRLEQRLHTLEQLSQQVVAYKGRLVESVHTFAEKHTFTLPAASSGPSTTQAQGAAGLTDFGSLEFDKYDDFNILARRIGEVTADISESMTQLSGSIHRSHDDMRHLAQLTLGMRDEIARARMVPIGTPFTRFHRATREMARATGKEVTLVTSGEHTEVDTGVVERLVDPLIHLVRNAVYHGIEPAAHRVSKGKPAGGTIYLHAAHRGNAVVIEVEDDGAGLDVEKIRSKAVERGLIRAEQARMTSESEIIKYIFMPGFSTADRIDDQAGRGVGMDVVKRAIESMNGRIEVESVRGMGTKFTLSLPLTLLIATALMVRVGSEHYGIPLQAIREVTMLTVGTHHRVGERSILHIGEEAIEVQPLRQLLTQSHVPVEMGKPVVIVRTTDGMLGLLVDELLGRQEIVIKSLGSFKSMNRSYFGGATIDPEGRVVLVLDPARLLTRGGHAVAAPESLQEAIADSRVPQIEAPDSITSDQAILLVDDSLSIRKFVSRMLESSGYRVETAVDGEDGLRKASVKNYRLIITDLEMPKLNGYEVIQGLRSRPQTQQTPIIVMTSRAGDKHRQMAINIGASSYIAKPVDERALIQEVERWIGKETVARK